jgi:hypothetical protein
MHGAEQKEILVQPHAKVEDYNCFIGRLIDTSGGT